MNKKTKHLLSSILFASTSMIYFLLAYVGYVKQNIDLTKEAMYENVVTDRAIGIRYDRKGRQSNVFYISLKDLDEKLGIYRMSKNYDDLLMNINIGEKIKVYYKPSTNKNEYINIDLIQIEKNGEILISKSEYEKKESFLIYIGLILGIGTLILAFRYYKYRGVMSKRRKKR